MSFRLGSFSARFCFDHVGRVVVAEEPHAQKAMLSRECML